MSILIQTQCIIDAGANLVIHIGLGRVKSLRKAAAYNVVKEFDGDFVLDAIVHVLQGVVLFLNLAY